MHELKPSVIDIDGRSIEVIDTGGDRMPLFLFHFNSGSYRSCLPLFDTELAESFRLVSVSLPGHGGSSPSLGDSYDHSIPGIGKAIARIIDAFSVDSYGIVAQSVSSHAVMENHKIFEGCKGFVSISAPPINLENLSNAFSDDPATSFLFAETLSDGDASSLADAFTLDSKNLALIKSDIFNTHSSFRPNLGASIGAGNICDELLSIQSMKFPCAFLCSRGDRFIKPDYYRILQDDYCLSLDVLEVEDSGHAIVLDQPVVCADLIERCFRKWL